MELNHILDLLEEAYQQGRTDFFRENMTRRIEMTTSDERRSMWASAIEGDDTDVV